MSGILIHQDVDDYIYLLWGMLTWKERFKYVSYNNIKYYCWDWNESHMKLGDMDLLPYHMYGTIYTFKIRYDFDKIPKYLPISFDFKKSWRRKVIAKYII